MFRCLAARALRLPTWPSSASLKVGPKYHPIKSLELTSQARFISISNGSSPFKSHGTCDKDALNRTSLFNQIYLNQYVQPIRGFHAKGSKVNYLDFRYRLNTGHLRSHLLIIRRQKMKKHRKIKWRKKYKCVLAKERLKREIAKEKTFRVELLTMIKRAEQFNPKEYALNKINEINNRPKELTKKEKFEELKELIRVNRYQTQYIKPKHRRVETYGLES